MARADELVEVYRCISEMEADRAMVEVLEPLGIESYLRDRVSHALPAPVSEPGNYFIAVAEDDAERAREALREALEDDVLDANEGELIESDEEAEEADEDEEEEDELV
jgi:hypothetical protein